MKSTYLIGITIFVFVLLFIGCTQQASTDVETPSTTDSIQETQAAETTQVTLPDSPEETTPELPTEETGITLEEVSSHDSRQDCWTVVDDKVYDVTEYIDQHEGGNSILQGCGKDSSELFASKHSTGARANLENYYLDDLR